MIGQAAEVDVMLCLVLLRIVDLLDLEDLVLSGQVLTLLVTPLR
jgi:hypothetical protein